MSYRIDPRLPLTEEARRILGEEIGKALGALEAARDRPEQGLHKCRKRLKAVRALLRLLRAGDEEFFAAENARYRQVAALLADTRQATALVETLERLQRAFPEETAGGGLDTVRDALAAGQRQVHESGDLGVVIDAAAAACAQGLRRVEELVLPDQPEQAADVLAEGTRATLRRARRALERAGSRGAPDDFHDLRKAAKAHGMHLSLLGRLWPTPIKARRKAVDELGESLGELQDVLVLRALVEAGDPRLGPPSGTKLLRKLLKRSERSLRKSCLAAAAELFGDSPKRSVRRLARKARGDFAAGGAADEGAAVNPP